MKNFKLLLNAVLILSTSGIYAQQMELVKKPLDAPEFYQNDNKYNMGELIKIMRFNNEAVYYMKKARTNYTFSQIFAFTGAGLVGYPIGTSLGGGDPQWVIAIAGAGIMALSIPFLTATNKHSKKAVELYNAGLPTSEKATTGHTFTFGLTGNGVSLAFQF